MIRPFIGSSLSLAAASLFLLLAGCAGAPIEKSEIEADPDATLIATDLHRDHGEAALRAERYADAASYFNRILKAFPEDQQARLGLGEAFLGQGHLDQALVVFEQLDDEAEGQLRIKAVQGQGLVWLRKGDHGKAKAFLDDAVAKDPDLWRGWNALGRLHDGEGEHEAARVAYRRAIEIRPKAAFLHNNLGFSLLASGNPAYAESSLRRALELDPELEVAATNLRLALALQGRYGSALAGADPSDRAVVMNNVGYAALLRGDHDKARSLFLGAMTADPGFFGEAKRNLAFLDTLESR